MWIDIKKLLFYLSYYLNYNPFSVILIMENKCTAIREDKHYFQTLLSESDVCTSHTLGLEYTDFYL